MTKKDTQALLAVAVVVVGLIIYARKRQAPVIAGLAPGIKLPGPLGSSGPPDKTFTTNPA